MARGIDDQIAELQRFLPWFRCAAAFEDFSDAQHQLARAEWLREIIVRTQFQSQHPVNLRRFGLRPLFRKRDVGMNLAIFRGDFLVEVIHQRAGGDTALFDSSARGSNGEEIEIHMISLLEKRSVQKFSLGFGGR